MKPRHLILGTALAVAAGLAAFGDKSPELEVAQPVERSQPRSQPRMQQSSAVPARAASDKPQPSIARLLPRDELIGTRLDRLGAGAREPFGHQDWTPPPPPPPPAPPPPPPSAPPLPFTVIGKALQDGRWEVYLASGERTHIAQEGGVIEGSWRVERIAPPLMTLTYLPLNQVQQLNIGVFD